MSIVVTLTPELEAKLREKATKQGQDINYVVTELLNQILTWEADDIEAAIEDIKRGLEDFEQGRFRDFEQFAEEQRRKYNLPID
jgi:predicted transcriptional regulator